MVPNTFMAVTFSIESTIKKRRKGKQAKVLRSSIKELNIIWFAASRAATAAIALTTPVDTGMAMGTVLPLARELKMFEAVQQLIKPKRRNVYGYTTLYGNWRPKVPKNSGLGLKIATGNSFRYREMKVGDQRLDYSWRMTSYQHVYHNISGNKWGNLIFAAEQFTAIINANIKRLSELLPEALVLDLDIKKTQLRTGGVRLGFKHENTLTKELKQDNAGIVSDELITGLVNTARQDHEE